MKSTSSNSDSKSACGVCGRAFAKRELLTAESIRPQIAQYLDLNEPDWRRTGFVCREDVMQARERYVGELLERERGELTDLDQAVISSIAKHEVLTGNVEEMFAERAAFGDRMADRIASFGGSWTFILSFGGVLLAWICVNSFVLLGKESFDPYPYILLNLMLSCVAAIQAPLIMMSQGRQEAKDRLRAENDYRVNLKAELEIRHLHEKLDHLLNRQWERLAEIQQIQLELMEDLSRKGKR